MEIESLDIDDGLDIVDDSNGTALIDADTLAYTTCLYLEVKEELLPKEFYTEEEWASIIDDPDYDEESHAIYRIDLDELLKEAKSKVEELRYKTRSKNVELYFSSGKTFRNKLCDTYKGQRVRMRYPEGLEWLKRELVKNYDGMVCEGFEADDIVVYKKRREPKKYKLVAVDKDVLKSVPGKHFDYYHKRMHWVETRIQEATKWPYIQALVGDTADNIAGVKGIGPKKAEKLLAEAVLPCDCWKVVVQAYEDNGLTIKHAIETMRLVYMHSLYEENGQYKIKLWEPPCEI